MGTAVEFARQRYQGLRSRCVDVVSWQLSRFGDANAPAQVRFPQLAVRTWWPAGRPVFVVVPLAGLFAAIAVAAFVRSIVVVSRWGSEPFVVTAGGAGLGIAAMGMLAMALGMVREVVPRSSFVFGYPVRRCRDLDRGAGVRVGHPTRVVPLVSTLLGLSVFGQACWWARPAGIAESFPFATLGDGWAIAALAGSVVLLVAAVLVLLAARHRFHVELYPSGVVRRNPLRDLREKDRFVSWDDIAAVDTRTQYIAPYLREGPTIVLRLTDSTTPPANRLFDKTGDFGIPAYLSRCNPNLLLTLLTHLAETPTSRPLLSTPGAQRWFTTHHHYPAHPTPLEPASSRP